MGRARSQVVTLSVGVLAEQGLGSRPVSGPYRTDDGMMLGVGDEEQSPDFTRLLRLEDRGSGRHEGNVIEPVDHGRQQRRGCAFNNQAVEAIVHLTIGGGIDRLSLAVVEQRVACGQTLAQLIKQSF